jgi:hypothetical protein
MNSLYPSVIRLVERAVHCQVEGFHTGIFAGPEEPWPRLGRHFSLQKEGGQEIIYPWFGVFETAMAPIIYIGFNGQPGWCQPVYEKILTQILSEGSHYKMPYKDILRHELCFTLKEENFDWLRSSEPAEKYERLLTDFFSEVVDHIGQYLA